MTLRGAVRMRGCTFCTARVGAVQILASNPQSLLEVKNASTCTVTILLPKWSFANKGFWHRAVQNVQPPLGLYSPMYSPLCRTPKERSDE